MKAIRYHGFGEEPGLEEVEEPLAGDREVVVRVKACQIGGDVLKIFAGAGPVRNRSEFEFPHIPGYRGAGVVESVGEEVTALAPGDRVAVNGFVNCGVCRYCRQGLDNLCERSLMLGIDSGAPGAYAELVKAPEWAVFRIPAELSFPRATLLANMALLVHALERAAVEPPFTAAIFGCGLVGSSAIAVARAYGATEIVGVDREPVALDFAERCGATWTVDADREDAISTIAEATEADGADVAIEVVGVGKTVEDAVRSTRPRGVTLLIGALDGISLAFPEYYRDVIQREVDIRPCFGKTQADFARAVDLAASGDLDLSPYSLQAHPLDAFGEALAAAADPGNANLQTISMEP